MVRTKKNHLARMPTLSYGFSKRVAPANKTPLPPKKFFQNTKKNVREPPKNLEAFF